MRILFLVVILFQFFFSCQKVNKKSVNGVWESIGHGKILEIIDSTTYINYDITSISCFPVQHRNFDEIIPYISLKNDTLTRKEGPFIFKYSRLKEMPELCQNYNPSRANDVLFNFDVFMQTVKENYAFLEFNNINWDELYTDQKAKLSLESTEADLYLLLEETYDLLNDNHAFLNAPDEVYDEIDRIAPEDDNSGQGLPEYGDFEIAKMVSQHHFKENMTEDSWIIDWGTLTDDIGYVLIRAMWLFADLDIPESLIESEGFVDAYSLTRISMLEANYMALEVEGVKKVMSKVMNDLSDMENIVIDVRFNGGGQDVVSKTIMSYFNAERKQIATQQYRFSDKHTNPHPLFLEVTENAYTKPVYLLTSPQSGSAAEIFALYSLAMPHVKIIGSATEGAMSSTLDKKLPNGWDFTVSNEIYRDNTGKFYENIGVPVDYELNYIRGNRQEFFRSVADDLDQDKRKIISAVEDLKMK